MARFAPVCPPQILQYFKDEGCLGDYHLVLAHDIAARPDLYHAVFDRPHYSSMEIILDNSVIELGGAVNIDTIVEAAKVVQPVTTVLPDVLLDSQKTLERCMAALPIWAEHFVRANLEPAFMFVPQGRTLEEWVQCAERFADARFVNYWGIPRNVVDKTEIGTRKHLSEILHALNSYREIHLLGFSNNVIDDVISAKSHFVHGIDSAVPIRAISQGISNTFEGYSKMPSRGDWWESAKPDHGMIDAFMQARQWFKRGRSH